MALETLKDVVMINGQKIVDMDDLKILYPERFPDGRMDYQWFESEIRPHNYIYVRHDVNSLSFTLQNGPVKETGVNGCQVADIIAVAKHMIEKLNQKFPCQENEDTISFLQAAITSQELRTRRRRELGIEGTSQEISNKPVTNEEPVKEVIELTQGILDGLKHSNKAYVLKFWAEWCGPCKVYSPVVDEVAKELDCPVYSVNVDKFSELAQEHSIRGIPAIVAVADKKQVGMIVGAKSKTELLKELKKLDEML